MSDFLILLVLLMLSGLFSGSETALTALSMARVEGLLKDERHGAQALFRLKSNPTRMLITLLIGNNVVNIGASAMATVIAVDWFGHLGPGIAVGVLTLVILVFGEVTPKSLAFRYAERISLAVAPLMLVVRWLVFPLVWILELFTGWLHRQLGVSGDPTVTESELLSMIRHGEREGTINYGNRALIERIFEFRNPRVHDVMTHRQQIFAVAGSRSIREVLPEVIAESHSRIPIFEDHPDEIRHIVYLRDILEAVAKGHLDSPVRTISREPLFVYENQHIDELFTMLLGEKRHLAVVVDEFGGLQGIVTLEDLLEELVGEIYDETDEPPEIRHLDENTIAVSGTVELRSVETFFDRTLPGKPTDTVSLWILTRTERIPATGETLIIDDLEVQVAKASNRSIQQVTISRPELVDAISQ